MRDALNGEFSDLFRPNIDGRQGWKKGVEQREFVVGGNQADVAADGEPAFGKGAIGQGGDAVGGNKDRGRERLGAEKAIDQFLNGFQAVDRKEPRATPWAQMTGRSEPWPRDI